MVAGALGALWTTATTGGPLGLTAAGAARAGLGLFVSVRAPPACMGQRQMLDTPLATFTAAPSAERAGLGLFVSVRP